MTSPAERVSMMRPGGRVDATIHGADLWENRLAFLTKAAGIISVIWLMVWAFFTLVLIVIFTDSIDRSQFMALAWAKLAATVRMGGTIVSIPIFSDGQWIEISRPAAFIANSMPRTWSNLAGRVGLCFFVASLPASLAGWKAWTIFMATGKEMRTNDYLRGAKLVEPEKINEIVQEAEESFAAKVRETSGKEPDPPVMELQVGPVRLPKDREIQGFYISGSTGSGKTVAQKSIMRQVREAKQKMVVYDPAPEFVREFWQPGDIILNPLDARGVYWEPWSEIRKQYDYKSFAESLIEMDPKYASFAQAAQTVLAAILMKTKTIQELVQACRQDLQSMEEFLKGTPAQGVITAANSRGSDTVMGMIRQKLSVLNYMLPPHYSAKSGESPFSIRDWVRDDDDKRWVFLVCPEDQRPLLRPLITLWFDIVSREMMTLTPNNDLPVEKRRRVWLMLEELPSLPAIPSLEGLTAKGRKYGAVWVITVQDPGQLYSLYSKEIASSILQNCNTWLIFRANNAETAQMVSRQIGQFEEMEKTTSFSFGVDGDRDGASHSARRALRDAVMPSEIQRLPDLNCYLILYGAYPATRISIPYVGFKEVQEGSIMRPDLQIGHAVATGEPQIGAPSVSNPQSAMDWTETDDKTPVTDKKQIDLDDLFALSESEIPNNSQPDLEYNKTESSRESLITNPPVSIKKQDMRFF